MKKLALFLLLCLTATVIFAQQPVPTNPLVGNINVQDSGSCSTANSYLVQVLPNGAATTTVNLSGTFSATVTVRVSNGGPWTTAGTQSSAGTVSYSTSGFVLLCADVTTYTSGAVTITITSTTGSGSGGLTIAPLVSLDTSTPVTVSTTAQAAFYNNQNATAATAVTYNLPTAAAGKQFCFTNSNNGSAADTGVLTIATSATGQFIVFTDGTLSATGGNVTSGGAAADSACVVGNDATHWQLYTQRGTWTKH